MSDSEQCPKVTVRCYVETDARATLATFLSAVSETAAADYSPKQIAAWSGPLEPEIEQWNRVRLGLGTLVAVVDDDVAGFSDVSDAGYIDMLFVSPRYGRRGVGAVLLAVIQRRAIVAGAQRLSADVSITARPFFERHGFFAIAEQHPVIRGVCMTNFHVVKSLCASARDG